MSYSSCNAERSGKVIWNPYLGPDLHQKFITVPISVPKYNIKFQISIKSADYRQACA